MLAKQKEQGVARKLVGLEAEGRRVPRRGMAVEAGGRAVGRVRWTMVDPTEACRTNPTDGSEQEAACR